MRLKLETNDDAPRIARAALEPLHDEVSDDVMERAALLTSEVITNAVRYSGGPEVRVDIWRSGGTLSVVVSDDGPGFEPVAQAGTIADTDGGFGLPLLDTLSETWGSGTAADSWVWFEVSPRITALSRPVLVADERSQGDELLDIRMVVESVKNHALLALDTPGRVTSWGAAAVALTGYTAEEMLGRSLVELYSPSAPMAFARDMNAAASDGWHQTERWIRRADGSELWAEVALAPIRDRSERPRGMSALISDHTQHKRAHDAREHLISNLREQAMTDELTGLPNRRAWTHVLERELARARRLETPLAIAMLDVDGFKAYNDAHGHPGGDDVLRAVAREWSKALRTSDSLARFGGDEFAVALPDCPPDLALTVIGRLQAGPPAAIKSSAGIASMRATDTIDGLVARADAALYDAKRAGLPVSDGTAVEPDPA